MVNYCQIKFLKNIYKSIGVHWQKGTLMNQFSIHGFYNLFYFWGPNHL
jgi:hypothetical protein